MNNHTGIHDRVAAILGKGVVHGKEPHERKIILCEGDSSKGKPGEDQRLLELANDGSWEIYSQSKRKTVLTVFKELNKRGKWKDLYAVVDKDEQKKKPKYENILFWPGVRDLEGLLLRSEAWPRLIRTVLNPNTGFNLRPTPPGDIYDQSLPEQFRIDESASAIAWQIHQRTSSGTGEKQTYRHTTNKDDQGNKLSRPQNPSYLSALEPWSASPPVRMPTELKELIEMLLDAKLEEEYELLEADDRAYIMQGKRVMDLLAARLFSETYHNQSETGIEQNQLNRLKNDLRKPGFCTNLRSMILKRVKSDEMKSHFPQFS